MLRIKIIQHLLFFSEFFRSLFTVTTMYNNVQLKQNAHYVTFLILGILFWYWQVPVMWHTFFWRHFTSLTFLFCFSNVYMLTFCFSVIALKTACKWFLYFASLLSLECICSSLIMVSLFNFAKVYDGKLKWIWNFCLCFYVHSMCKYLTRYISGKQDFLVNFNSERCGI